MSKNNTYHTPGRLHGFPKGWTIFMIVYESAVAITVLPYLGDAPGLILLFLLFLAGMIVGLALMLKRRAYGFWILLAGSVLITLMNGARSGSYTAITSGGLSLVAITFFITRKQLGLFVKKNVPAGNSKPCDSAGSIRPEPYPNHTNDHANHSNTYGALSLDSFNSPVFEWSGSEYIGANLEWVEKIRQESNDAITWFNAQNFVPLPTGLGPQVEAEYCYSMAEQAQDAGNIQEAWAGFYQALQRYCRLNDSKKIGLSCFNLGKVYGVRKNWELAMLMFLHSVFITKKIGDQKGFAWSAFYLADVMNNLGDKATAKLFATEVLSVFRQVLPENVAGVEAAIRRYS